jgi:hypothetical protein
MYGHISGRWQAGEKLAGGDLLPFHYTENISKANSILKQKRLCNHALTNLFRIEGLKRTMTPYSSAAI